MSVPAIPVNITPASSPATRRGDSQQPEDSAGRREDGSAQALLRPTIGTGRTPGTLRGESVSTGSNEAQTASGAAASNAGADARNSTRRSLLSDAERAQLQRLRARDREVRAHEAAHAAAGGSYAGAPSYSYQRGPDGVQYAIGGSVPIDTAPIPGDPAATIEKMRRVRAAALAPANPSQADRRIAARAARELSRAQAELAQQSGDSRPDDRASTRSALGARAAESAENATGIDPADTETPARDARIERALATYREIADLIG